MLQLKNFLTSLETIYSNIKDEGVILSIGDGIVKASGLRNVTAGEMVVMGNYSVKGIALNLKHDIVFLISWHWGALDWNNSTQKCDY